MAENANFDQKWSKMPILAKNGPKCLFWSKMVENADFGRKRSEMLILTENGRNCRFWPKMVEKANSDRKWSSIPILSGHVIKGHWEEVWRTNTQSGAEIQVAWLGARLPIFDSGRKAVFWYKLVKNGRKYQFRPRMSKNVDFDGKWSKMPILTENGRKYRFRQKMFEIADFARKWSKTLVLTKNGRKCRFRKKILEKIDFV